MSEKTVDYLAFEKEFREINVPQNIIDNPDFRVMRQKNVK